MNSVCEVATLKYKLARQKAGLERQQAALLMGISYSYLAKIEREKRFPGRETIIKMQKLYGCTFTELF